MAALRSTSLGLACLLLGGVLALVAAPAAVAEPAPVAWATSRFDTGNTAYNPFEAGLSTANVASLAEEWSARAERNTSPVVAGGVVYTGCDGTSFCAFDATDGTTRWKTFVGETVTPNSAALDGDVIFVGASRPPVMYALDAATGAVIWRTLVSNSDSDFDSTTLAAGGLVFQSTGGFLFAWDAATGIQRWVRPLPTRSTPALVNGVLYVQAPPESPSLHAVRAGTGETLWRSNTAPGYWGASPIVWGGLIVVSQTRIGDDGRLAGFPVGGCGTTVCQPVWTVEAPVSLNSAAAAGGVLYHGLDDGHLAAFATSGQLLWKGVTQGASFPIPTATGRPTVANGLVFASGGDGSIYAWPAGGCGTPVCQPLWKGAAGRNGMARSDIVVLGGRVYAVDETGLLHAFTPRLNPPPVVTPPPVPAQPDPRPARTTPTTIHVPRDHQSIQRAIDASVAGDVVLVAPGTYHERLDFNGRAVEVRSSDGPEATIIDGDRVSTVVMFRSDESRTSVLRGFTVLNGKGNGSGGGIRALRASPTVVGNVVTGNQAISGNGIDVSTGAPLIEDNLVKDNHSIPGSGGNGGGISLSATPGAEVLGNVIEDNSTTGSGGGILVSGPATVADNVVRHNRAAADGGGMEACGDERLLVRQNVVVANTAGTHGGGIKLCSGDASGPVLLSNTLAANSAWAGSAIQTRLSYGQATLANNVLTGPPGQAVVECDDMWADVPPVFSHNDVYNGAPSPVVGCGAGAAGVGISADPRFVDPDAGDFRLAKGSPAIDAGDGSVPMLAAADASGSPRVVDGDGDGVARVDMGAYEAQVPVPERGAGFHPLVPSRILDTRNGTGGLGAAVGAGATISVPVLGHGGVPATGVAAVVLNVTATQPTAVSYLTVFPSGTARPLASNLNFVPGQTVPNLVTAKVGADGKVAVYNNAGATHVVMDVVGWYDAPGSGGGSRLNPLPPGRVLDTRTRTGGFQAPVAGGSSISVPVTGVGEVPATSVSAVILNVTATQPTAETFLTVFPSGAPRPLASNLNVLANQTVPNLVFAKVGPDGKVAVYNNAGTTHVVLDVVGWFGADGGAAGDRYIPLPPARVLDSRTGGAPVGPGATVPAAVTGAGGVPASGVSAVVLNVTVTQPTAEGYLTVYPTGMARPVASNLNFVPGQTVPNLVVAKVGADGKVALYNNLGASHVVLDVVGWYSKP